MIQKLAVFLGLIATGFFALWVATGGDALARPGESTVVGVEGPETETNDDRSDEPNDTP